jgi:hypothetical protein
MGSHIELKATVHFDELNKILSEFVQDLELNEQLTIHKVKVNSNEGRLVILADVSGIYSGDVKITCIPSWQKEEQRLQLDELDVKLLSKNILAMGANWMANNLMSKTIDKKFEAAMNVQIKELIASGIQKAAHFPTPIGGAFQLESPDFDIQDVRLGEKAMHFLLILDGETNFIL